MHDIFIFLQNTSSVSIIAWGAQVLSYPIAYLLPLFLMIWAVFFAQRKMYTFSLFFLSGITAWIGARILKDVFQIARPTIYDGVMPLIIESGFSFPSEHASVFAALAIAGFCIDRKSGIALSLIALLIGVSRIVLGVHFPVDVIAGFCVGILVGLFYTKIFKKI